MPAVMPGRAAAEEQAPGPSGAPYLPRHHKAGRLIAVVIPGHNEAEYIARTLEGVLGQSRRPDSVTVMCDNCTDNTAEVAARFAGVTVMHSVANTHRKSGALNQALDSITADMDGDDLVVCMDADTIIDVDLLRNAERHMEDDGRLAAVSSNHLISDFDTHHYITLMQAMEYERDRRFVGRRKGRYGCMTGMAAMYRVAALRDVRAVHGTFYNEDNWTEDWYLTMALKHLRQWRMIRPQDCLAATVPVPTISLLITQRVRWARGYLQTLRQFGVTRWTLLPWIKQLGLLWSVTARVLIFWLLWLSRGHLTAMWMTPVFILFIADAVNTSHKAGWRAVAAAIFFPLEIAYAWIITAAIITGYFRELTGIGADAEHFKRVRR
jgi:cellulose synthase/poly-beta-1,6-N-acetylglucosamine synthase-like glycosyltransferase